MVFDPNPLGAELVGQHLHQPDDAVLGRRVGRHIGKTFEAGQRTDDRDGAAAVGVDQMRRRRADRVPHAGEVDVNEVLPGLFGHQVAFRPEGEDPSVGDHRIQVAEFGYPFVHRALQRRGVPYVGLAGDDSPVERLDLPNSLNKVVGSGTGIERADAVHVGAQIDSDDVGALFGQAYGVRAALAPCRTGDKGDLALYSSHDLDSFPSMDGST